jgi:sugar lactone lactonase YvrE
VNRTIRTLGGLLALILAGRALAEGISLRLKGTVYQDEKEVPLAAPEGLACSEAQLVVADTGNGRLVRYDLHEGVPVGPHELKVAELKQPGELDLDPKGTLYVLDRKSRKIGRVNPDGTFGGFVEVKGVTDPAAVVPLAFKLDGASGLALIDAPTRQVLVLDASGALVRQVPLPKGEFTDIALDGGALYIVDTVTSVVYSAGKTDKEFKALGKGLKDVLTFPRSFSLSRGTLVVGDQHGHGVVFVGTDGTYQGRQLDMGWTEGVVYYPSAICANAGGDVFVADRGNNRVQAFTTKK